jgi:hypothetical protein
LDFLQHHYLNKTTGAKTYVKQQLKTAFKAQLSSGNMISKDLKTSPQLTPVITKMNSALTYPPTPDAHRQAISHQIATGMATAYNAKNVTVKIQMDANAPKDVCLGLPKLPCFRNQASRWYNQLNVTPLHY